MDFELALFTAYFSATLLFTIIISIWAFDKRKDKRGIKHFWSAITKARSLYGSVLVHLYDTTTDSIIIIGWTFMAIEEVTGRRDYENVNMLSFVIPSISLVLVYRVAYAVQFWVTFRLLDHFPKCDIGMWHFCISDSS